MKKYKKKPVVIEAERWFKLGDVQEAKIELYSTSKDVLCKNCGKLLIEHGWIETLEGGHIVCPGDYVVKGIKGEYYPIKPDIFIETYEEI